MEHPIGEFMNITMSKIKDMVDVNTVVGNPINTPDGVTIIPVSRLSFGFASGGSDFTLKEQGGFAGGNGAGVKVDPMGFLVVRDGNVRMVTISPPAGTTVDRVVEMIPDIIDKVEGIVEKHKKDK